MEQIRNEWVSDNRRYKVLARRFEDKSFHVSCFIKNSRGKYVPVLQGNLPQYIKDKINEMRKEVEK